jgi:transposase
VRKLLTEDDEKYINDILKEHDYMPMQENIDYLAKDLGVSESTIRKAVREDLKRKKNWGDSSRDETIAKINALGKKKLTELSCRKLAKMFNVSYNFVYMYTDKRKHPSVTRLTEEQKKELVDLKRAGFKNSVLVKRFNIDDKTIYSVLKKYEEKE